MVTADIRSYGDLYEAYKGVNSYQVEMFEIVLKGLSTASEKDLLRKHQLYESYLFATILLDNIGAFKNLFEKYRQDFPLNNKKQVKKRQKLIQELLLFLAEYPEDKLPDLTQRTDIMKEVLLFMWPYISQERASEGVTFYED